MSEQMAAMSGEASLEDILRDYLAERLDTSGPIVIEDMTRIAVGWSHETYEPHASTLNTISQPPACDALVNKPQTMKLDTHLCHGMLFGEGGKALR